MTDTLNILAVGDVVGKAGRKALRELLSEFRVHKKVDFCIVNGENAAGGSGITEKVMDEMLEAGADVITSGDHIFKRKEIIGRLDNDPRILRPYNLPERAAGRGMGLFHIGDTPVGVVNIIGRTYMPPVANCPFDSVDYAIEKLGKDTKIIVVDFHAEATSEKVAMGWYLDGRVSAVYGTHTHIQTADERILHAGTGYITDIGMTGPYESVIGRKKERILAHLLTGMPTPFDVANSDLRLCGVLLKIEKSSGRTLLIERVQERLS